MQFLYLGLLLFSAFGMATLDKKYSLAFFYDYRRTLIALGAGLLLFSVWDVAGIVLGVFFSGHSAYMSGMYILPEFPIEEVIFLLFLSYFTLIVYRLGERRW